MAICDLPAGYIAWYLGESKWLCLFQCDIQCWLEQKQGKLTLSESLGMEHALILSYFLTRCLEKTMPFKMVMLCYCTSSRQLACISEKVLYIAGTCLSSVFGLLGFNPPKQGLFQSKQGSFGFQVYIYIIYNILYHVLQRMAIIRIWLNNFAVSCCELVAFSESLSFLSPCQHTSNDLIPQGNQWTRYFVYLCLFV